jgi:hypothetical protein
VSYYQGDYYRGGFFGAIGHLLGGAAKHAVGFIPGVGPIASKVIGAVGKARGVMTHGAAIVGPLARRGGAMVVKHPVLSAAAAAGVAAGGASMMRHPAAAFPGGPAAAGSISHAERMALGRLRHHKRMNVCNPRALRRAIRRTHGFAKLAMKTIHLIHPKKKVRFGGFRRRRKKS